MVKYSKKYIKSIQQCGAGKKSTRRRRRQNHKGGVNPRREEEPPDTETNALLEEVYDNNNDNNNNNNDEPSIDELQERLTALHEGLGNNDNIEPEDVDPANIPDYEELVARFRELQTDGDAAVIVDEHLPDPPAEAPPAAGNIPDLDDLMARYRALQADDAEMEVPPTYEEDERRLPNYEEDQRRPPDYEDQLPPYSEGGKTRKRKRKRKSRKTKRKTRKTKRKTRKTKRKTMKIRKNK